MSEIPLSAKLNTTLLQVKWAKLSEEQSPHLEGILASSGSKEAQKLGEEACGLRRSLSYRFDLIPVNASKAQVPPLAL